MKCEQITLDKRESVCKVQNMNGPQRGTVASTPTKRTLTANDHVPQGRSLNEGARRANGKASEAGTGGKPTREDRRSAHDGGMVDEVSRLVRSLFGRALLGAIWNTSMTNGHLAAAELNALLAEREAANG